MQQRDFINNILLPRLDKTKKMFLRKNKEYGLTDTFHNFRVAARVDGKTPIQALRGMDLKHRVSVQDMCENPDKVTKDMIDEKIGDCVIYLCLLEGLFIEHIGDNSKFKGVK